MINEKQARALVALLHEIRRSWSIPSMMKLFEKHHDHPAPFQDIAVAAVTAANDQTAATPGIIFIDTRFWPEAIKPKLPKPDPCPEHEWEPAHHCRACLSDVLAGDREPHTVGTTRAKPRQKQPPPQGWRPTRTEPRPIPQPRPTPET